MKPVRDLFPELLPHVPGCPEPLARVALVSAARSFCERSSALRERLTLTTQAGQGAYTVVVPAGTTLVRVLAATYDGNRQLFPRVPPDATQSAEGAPRYYWAAHKTRTVEVYPRPNEAKPLELHVALQPTTTAEELPDELHDVESWRAGVLDGAKGYLMALPAQPFSNPAMGAAYARLAFAAAMEARFEASIGLTQGSLRAQPRPFA